MRKKLLSIAVKPLRSCLKCRELVDRQKGTMLGGLSMGYWRLAVLSVAIAVITVYGDGNAPLVFLAGYFASLGDASWRP